MSLTTILCAAIMMVPVFEAKTIPTPILNQTTPTPRYTPYSKGKMAQTTTGAINDYDWPLHSHDLSNTNYNPVETKLDPTTARHLIRAFETFNDDSATDEDPPTGFVLESPETIGLSFPSSVVGVVASPLVIGGTVYYVDILGTVFARNAQTGGITDETKHWTTTLVDPDFDNTGSFQLPPVLPELIYTAPIVTDTHIWVIGSVFGRLHAISLENGDEVDFDSATPDVIDPYSVAPEGFQFASVLGDSVIVNYDGRYLYITNINVILNDVLAKNEEVGLQVAVDITDPENPFEAWRTFSIDLNEKGERFGAGVSVGAGLAVDLSRNLIFGGTGQNTRNPYEGYPNIDLAPPGYIDRSDAVYAIDIGTGEFEWFNQFHLGDVFNLEDPVSTAPNQPNGPRDADVLSPPVLFSAEIDGTERDLIGVGSKGGLYRVVNRVTGATVWDKQISKATGLGGIQAGSAFADGAVYVVGFEGIDDGFSDTQFGTAFGGQFPNAFSATFSPKFWADVEDTADDGDPSTGMRMLVYKLDAATGETLWTDSKEFIELRAGAAMRHCSVANGLLFVTSTSGTLFVLDAESGDVVFTDQTLDLNEEFDLGLGKPHHAGMNAGTLISDGMVYVGYGGQNNPSGGIIAYKIDILPACIDIIVELEDKIFQDVPDKEAGQLNKFLVRIEEILVGANGSLTQQVIQRATQSLIPFQNQVDRLVKTGKISEIMAGLIDAKTEQIRQLLFSESSDQTQRYLRH